MFRLNRVMRPLRQLFHPNALLTSPAVMYSAGTDQRKVLPAGLLSSVVKLTCKSSANGGTCDVYLVGAVPYAPKYLEEFSRGRIKPSHLARSLAGEETFEAYKDVSREREKACQEVRGVISSLKPEVVFLGLDPSLSHDLSPDQMLRRILGSFFYQKILRRILGSLFDREVIPEYQAAYEEAQKHEANVVLGDRPRKITWRRTNLSASLLFNFFNLLMPNQVMNVAEFYVSDGCVEWFGRHNESNIKRVFVDERDQYMSATLLKVARQHSSVVAVVGKCHLSGIQNYWKQPIKVGELLDYYTWPLDVLLVKSGILLIIICVSFV